MNSLNFNRGIFRLWLAASLAWALTFIYLMTPGIFSPTFEAFPPGIALTDQQFYHPKEYPPTTALMLHRTGEMLRVALMPPAVLFALGLVVRWIGRGFLRR